MLVVVQVVMLIRRSRRLGASELLLAPSCTFEDDQVDKECYQGGVTFCQISKTRILQREKGWKMRKVSMHEG